MANGRKYFRELEVEEGRHQSFNQKLDGEYAFRQYQGRTTLDAYNAVTKELQEMIGECIRDDKTLRARGSLWSLSEAAVTDGRLINTTNLRLAFDLGANLVDGNYAGDAAKLRFIECGASIGAINRYLFKDRLSLKASGSNNGQTLAGALSTGTHGGAYKVGAVPEMVVGLHLVTGPNKHVYVERESYPVMKKDFADRLGAEYERNDTLFNAALVSFGSFGVIHGILIEARELFVLNALRFNHDYDDRMKRAINTLDPTKLKLPNEAAGVPEDRFYHFEIFYNPNEDPAPGESFVLTMIEEKWDENYEEPEWDEGDPGMGASGLDIMGALLGVIPAPIDKLVASFLNDQVREQYAPYVKKAIIRDLFRGEKVLGKTLASGVALPVDRAVEALDIAIKTYKDFGVLLPLILSHRFVKGTQALLGFTRFDTTAVLEIDAINTPKTQEYLNKVWAKLDAAGIPFTLHWGKFNSFLTADVVRDRYGDAAVDDWIASRETLLENNAARQVFNNPFIKRLGLDR